MIDEAEKLLFRLQTIADNDKLPEASITLSQKECKMLIKRMQNLEEIAIVLVKQLQTREK